MDISTIYCIGILCTTVPHGDRVPNHIYNVPAGINAGYRSNVTRCCTGSREIRHHKALQPHYSDKDPGFFIPDSLGDLILRQIERRWLNVLRRRSESIYHLLFAYTSQEIAYAH